MVFAAIRASDQQYVDDSMAIRTLSILGSGGHTAELLTLVQSLDQNVYSPHCFVIASDDASSQTKLKQLPLGKVAFDLSLNSRRVH